MTHNDLAAEMEAAADRIRSTAKRGLLRRAAAAIRTEAKKKETVVILEPRAIDLDVQTPPQHEIRIPELMAGGFGQRVYTWAGERDEHGRRIFR